MRKDGKILEGTKSDIMLEWWERLSLAVVGNQEDRLAQMRLSLWFGSMAKPL